MDRSGTEKTMLRRAKSKKQRFLNPAACGSRPCHMHGARQQNSIKCGELHLNYLHGTEPLERKRRRSMKLAKLREIENKLIKRGLVRW